MTSGQLQAADKLQQQGDAKWASQPKPLCECRQLQQGVIEVGSAVLPSFGVVRSMMDPKATTTDFVLGAAGLVPALTELKGVKLGVDAEADAVRVINLPKSRFGEAAQHAEDAQIAGKPSVLTIDRGGIQQNRKDALKGIDSVPGKQNDEYPPAMFREGGVGASIRAIDPADNISAGAYIGNCCRTLPNGAKVQIEVTR